VTREFDGIVDGAVHRSTGSTDEGNEAHFRGWCEAPLPDLHARSCPLMRVAENASSVFGLWNAWHGGINYLHLLRRGYTRSLPFHEFYRVSRPRTSREVRGWEILVFASVAMGRGDRLLVKSLASRRAVDAALDYSNETSHCRTYMISLPLIHARSDLSARA
jgi:hypothetical protein